MHPHPCPLSLSLASSLQGDGVHTSNGNGGFDIGLAAIESGSISLSSAAMRLEVIVKAR